jgi:hypothetical protein
LKDASKLLVDSSRWQQAIDEGVMSSRLKKILIKETYQSEFTGDELKDIYTYAQEYEREKFINDMDKKEKKHLTYEQLEIPDYDKVDIEPPKERQRWVPPQEVIKKLGLPLPEIEEKIPPIPDIKKIPEEKKYTPFKTIVHPVNHRQSHVAHCDVCQRILLKVKEMPDIKQINIARDFGFSRQNISHHWKFLRSEGYVHDENQ